MGKTIYITESQFRQYIRHKIQRLNESSNGDYGYFTDGAGYFKYSNETNMPYKIAKCKEFLDDMFARTTTQTYNGKRHITDVRCAILKKEMDNKEAKKYFDKDIEMEVEDFCVENGWFKNNKDYLNKTFLPFFVNAWFKGLVKVR